MIGLLAIFDIGRPHPLWRPEVQRFLLFGALMFFTTGWLGSHFASLVRDSLAGANASRAMAIGWAALGAVLIGSMGCCFGRSSAHRASCGRPGSRSRG